MVSLVFSTNEWVGVKTDLSSDLIESVVNVKTVENDLLIEVDVKGLTKDDFRINYDRDQPSTTLER
jgi:hypothetical protein